MEAKPLSKVSAGGCAADVRMKSPREGYLLTHRYIAQGESASGQLVEDNEVALALRNASVGDDSNFKNGKSFAAFIGLVPKQLSSGGKERFGKI